MAMFFGRTKTRTARDFFLQKVQLALVSKLVRFYNNETVGLESLYGYYGIIQVRKRTETWNSR